jgi:hypothetical protein
MRRGISRLDTLLLTAGCAGLFLWTLAGARPTPRKPSFRAQPASTLGHESVSLETQPLPVPRYNIGLVDGKLGDLAVLKPGSVLKWANLRGAHWRGLDLRGVMLWNVDLRDADLREADLRGAILAEVMFSGTDLRGADLRDAVLELYFPGNGRTARGRFVTGGFDLVANLRGATYDSATRWPPAVDQ